MAREHSSIKMTPEELDEFLASDRRLVVATNDADGGGWADVVAYCYQAGRVYFRVSAGTRTAANLDLDARVCCVVESKPTGSTYYGIKGAILHDTAVPLGDDDPEATAVRASLAARPDPVDPAAGGDGAIVSVGLGDSTSFVFEKIRYRYEDRRLTEERELTSPAAGE